MSEASAQPADSKVSKRPHFVRQLSKTYEKGKEAMKRNLLTPRGPKTAKSAELPLPDTKPEAPTDSAAQVRRVHSWSLPAAHCGVDLSKKFRCLEKLRSRAAS